MKSDFFNGPPDKVKPKVAPVFLNDKQLKRHWDKNWPW